MAKVNLVEKQVRLGLDEIIKFQLASHCHLYKIPVSDSDLSSMATLGIVGEIELSEFCVLAASKKIFKTVQTVRNSIAKMEKYGMIIKDGPSKKRTIKLNPNLKIQTEGNILLMYKVVHKNGTS